MYPCLPLPCLCVVPLHLWMPQGAPRREWGLVDPDVMSLVVELECGACSGLRRTAVYAGGLHFLMISVHYFYLNTLSYLTTSIYSMYGFRIITGIGTLVDKDYCIAQVMVSTNSRSTSI